MEKLNIAAVATLKTKKDQSIRRYHPWVFSGAVKSWEGEPIDGDVVEVRSNKGGLLGYGYFQDQSTICIRMITFGDNTPSTSFWTDSLEKAWRRREKLGLVENNETNMYRLVFAEGDGLPGLIIDMYDGHAVMQAYSIATYHIKDIVVEFLKNKLGSKLKSVYVKMPEHIKTLHGVDEELVYGNEISECIAKENGTKYHINWETGQKTGFFIDQRDNRKWLGSISKGKKVLNTFCYTGGFSIEALKGGAAEVHSLDSSETALQELERNLALNGLENANHKTIKADAVDYIKSMETDYDIIVLDPPAFAKSISSRHKAIQGYKRLNARAIEHIKPGGLILTFSCSQVVDKFLFNSTVLAAAIPTGREIKVLGQLHQPADHPYSIYHPEGEYLKGLVIQVD
ncbi:class I SAM-dependent rRNA methyltransferase [Luteibaculum oceani]|uniref:Class I SAM-dependent rRNA methyltransferase n=1 Tax=Luteibaculum oceani TaxID=1294296 RepID=A0A5C6UVR8_9FLAO|nr:class I SAM-dependent rRNA methyltransferase [Luteibaculum oceani]TXC76236.1 class I SAM-dependent rRNA methyltransferase [Luteibaculum oceani]